MRIEQLVEALDRHGGDLSCWPAALRTEAEALIVSDAAALRLVADAARLDGALKEIVRPMAVDAALVGRIIASIADGARHDVAVLPTPRLIAWAGAAIVALLVGGYAAGIALPASQGEDAFAGLIFGNSVSASATDSGSLL